MGEPAILPFDWADPFDLNHQLTDEERMVRDTAGAYARDNLQPRVTEAYLNENFDREILREMGNLGLLGATIPETYGAAVSAGYAVGQFSETPMNNASPGLGVVMPVAFLGLSWLLSRKLEQIVQRY